MITSKRDLKKHIDDIYAEVTQNIIPMALLSGFVNEKEASDMITKLDDLTFQAHSRLSIAFDKTPKSFDSISAYKKARRQYFKAAFDKALLDYENGVNEVLKAIKAPEK